MKIAIDGRMYNESGIGRYIRNLLTQLQRLDKDNEYFILHLKDDYDSIVYHNNFNKVLANLHWYGLTEQIKLPKIIKQLKVDLLHFPHFNVPIFYKGKFVVTIHDLIHQHYSMQRASTQGPFIYKIKQFGYKKVFQHAIKKSSLILVPSQFVKRQLTSEWDVAGNRIVVTAEACDDKIFSIEKKMDKEKIAKVIKKFSIKMPYIFYVGNAHPHKNVAGLIKAFLVLKKKFPNLKLVLSGHDHYFWQRIKKEYLNEAIVYAGYVSDEELVALYKNAQSFVMPSFEEGFGIPLIEAMACSCPVVSSNAGALPEVGGNACVYFHSNNLDDMVDKIDQVLSSQKLRNELIKKGQKRVKQFSWEKLAKQTLKGYLQCA